MTTTADVPGRYDVAINGVGYQLDEDGQQPALVRSSVRQQREQASGANANIGEATINPEGFWRRSRDGWSHGAGQSYGDRDTSDPERFRLSSNVDVFSSPYQVTLLHSFSEALSFTGLGTLLIANDRAYFSDGATLKYASSPLTTPWSTTTVTGTPTAIDGMTTLGGTIYLAGDTQGVYSGSAAGSTVSSYATGTADGIAVAKGRLMVWNGSVLYNITAAGAFPSALITFPSGQVAGVVGAGNHIYIAVSSDPSMIYKTTIKADGTALDVPSAAAELPAGETLVSFPLGSAIFAYLNLVFVHTNRGIRMGVLDSDGNITFGSLIPVGEDVNFGAWAAYDRFVWANAASDAGLVKMDLAEFILPNTPAYAHDFDDGTIVESAVVFEGRMIVATNGDKVKVESATTYVSSGTVHSGLLSLDLSDTKTPVALDLEAAYPDNSSITEAISVDRGATFTTIDTWDSGDTTEQAITGVAASRNFELRTTLTASTDLGDTPVLYRHTLKAEPNVTQGDFLILRLRLYESVVDNTGAEVGRTPATDLAALRALQEARTVVDVQEGSLTHTGVLRDMEWEAHSRCASADDGSWNGVATVRVKIVDAA